MSQHDYVLDNAAGASFRADVNNALGAIATQNSGSSEPSTKYAYMLWADTTSGYMKQRNAANSAWIVLWPLASGPTVIDRSIGTYATNADLTTQIPGDDTIPQNTEGTQIISVSFTPKSATNRIRLRFNGEASAANVVTVAAALFSSASANALAATSATVSATNYGVPLVVEHEYVPGVTTAITFSVRVGPTSAVTMRMNGNSGGRLFGGVMAATLVIEEIAA